MTLICDDFDMRKSVLQYIGSKASALDLSFKPAKCVSFLSDGVKLLSQGIVSSKGMTRSITDGHTKFLGKVIDNLSRLEPNIIGNRMAGRGIWDK